MENNSIIDLVNGELVSLGYMSEVDSYELIYINKILARKLKLTDDSYKGKKCYEVIHNLSRPCEHCKQNVINNKVNEDNEYYSWCFSDAQKNIHFSLKEKIVEVDGKQVHLVASLDITNEVLQEEELSELSNMDEGIIQCVKKLINEPDTDFAINSLLEIVCKFYDGCRSYIFEIDYDNKVRHCTFDYCMEGLPLLTDIAQTVPFDCKSQWGKYLTEQSYFYTNDINRAFDESEYDRDLLNGGGVTSMLNIPLTRFGTLAGYIGVDNPHKYDDNYKLLATIAAFILNIIDKQRALVKLKEDKSKLDNTFQVGETLIDCAKSLLDDVSDTDASIRELLKTICIYYDCECAYIFEWDRDTSEVSNTYEHVLKNNSCVNDLNCICPDLINGWFDILEEKGIYLVLSCNEELDHSSADYLLFASSSIESIVMVPLFRDNKIIGALGMDNISKNEDNTNLLHTLSGFVMNYVQKRDLIKELEFLSYTDKLTGLYNRNYYLNSIEEIKTSELKSLGVVFADVNGLKKANDKLGHEYGDILLKWCANFIKQYIGTAICRIGGDEFVCLIEDIDQCEFDKCMNTMREEISKLPNINMSIGSTWHEDNIDVDRQIIETDKMMYLEKQRYYAIMAKRNLSPAEELSQLKEAILGLKEMLNDATNKDTVSEEVGNDEVSEVSKEEAKVETVSHKNVRFNKRKFPRKKFNQRNLKRSKFNKNDFKRKFNR